ncbi:hypothetical protein QBC46DRAFT_409504 [Diplogelasinospora grovesii]|uniref:RING-type domain-containing protein n=1 Tax=Diplogelasinospora grovesii TaxID=303347 RepID=A0AAN6S3G3_9PEZI|nr:hypothetical protein QBC46DRAFT_409504 [Diplogelasinospora grovesii]
MDEMDYVVHSPDGSASQAQQPQHSGCPYFRAEQHAASLPHPQPHLGHPNVHPHVGMLSPIRSVPQHQHQHHQQHANPQPHSHPSPQHYDPVHAASGQWYPTQVSPQWPGTFSLPLPHVQPPVHQHRVPGPGSDVFFSGFPGNSNSSNGGPGTSGAFPIGVSNMNSGSTSQAPLTSIPNQLPHYHDPLPAFPFAFRPQHPSHSSHPSHRYPVHSQPLTHHQQFPPNADRSIAHHSTPRGISLPALNPCPPTLVRSAPSNMSSSSSSESSPVASASQPVSHGSSRGQQSRGSGDVGSSSSSSLSASSSSSTTTSAPLPARHMAGAELPSRIETNLTAPSEMETVFNPIAPNVMPPAERRRSHAAARARTARAAAQGSDYDSDDDSDPLEAAQRSLRLIETAHVSINPFHRSADMDEARIRAHQLVRGQMPNKRIASKRALSQLQSVDMSTLEESERTCVICYNEFGVPNPEGINEAPLRLPKCKHIFGDHCIKKWFEESDSCPYCRDKVHSELPLPHNAQALRDYLRSSYAAYAPRTQASVRSMVETGRLPPGETFVRILAQRDENRSDANPLRGWQTGERRSPPSEASETRRRTRARHGSFRASPSTSTSNATRPTAYAAMNAQLNPQPQQQSAGAARERVIPPYVLQPWFSLTHGPHQSLTPSLATQPLPGSHRPYYPTNIGRYPMSPFTPAYMEPMGMTSMSSNPDAPLTYTAMMHASSQTQPFTAQLDDDDSSRLPSHLLQSHAETRASHGMDQAGRMHQARRHPMHVYPFPHHHLPPLSALRGPGVLNTSPNGHPDATANIEP